MKTQMKAMTLGLSFFILGAQAQESDMLNEKEIQDAYNYFIGRLLILRQEHIDFKENGYEWNKLYPREVGQVTWANPNLDVAYSEAWIAIDEKSCAIVELPQIKERYFTFQVLNSWGETVSNINERTFRRKPYGRFAFCNKGSTVRVADNIQRIDLTGKKFRVLSRIELGSTPGLAVSFQKEMKLFIQGDPKIDEAVKIPIFDNKKLIGAEGFDKADEILKSEPDINPGMEPLQEKVRQLQVAIKDKNRRTKIEKLMQDKIIPTFLAETQKLGTTKNGWQRADIIGNYEGHYLERSYVNLSGIWANNKSEAIYFVAAKDTAGKPLNGNNVYTLTFPKNQMPQKQVKYFWSVVAVDSMDHKVMENQLNRYVFNNQNRPVQNKDGSTTMVIAKNLPEGFNQENWLPVQENVEFNLTFRLYGPRNDTYFPPEVVHMVRTMQAQETKTVTE